MTNATAGAGNDSSHSGALLRRAASRGAWVVGSGQRCSEPAGRGLVGGGAAASDAESAVAAGSVQRQGAGAGRRGTAVRCGGEGRGFEQEGSGRRAAGGGRQATRATRAARATERVFGENERAAAAGRQSTSVFACRGPGSNAPEQDQGSECISGEVHERTGQQAARERVWGGAAAQAIKREACAPSLGKKGVRASSTFLESSTPTRSLLYTMAQSGHDESSPAPAIPASPGCSRRNNAGYARASPGKRPLHAAWLSHCVRGSS